MLFFIFTRFLSKNQYSKILKMKLFIPILHLYLWKKSDDKRLQLQKSLRSLVYIALIKSSQKGGDVYEMDKTNR